MIIKQKQNEIVPKIKSKKGLTLFNQYAGLDILSKSKQDTISQRSNRARSRGVSISRQHSIKVQNMYQNKHLPVNDQSKSISRTTISQTATNTTNMLASYKSQKTLSQYLIINRAENNQKYNTKGENQLKGQVKLKKTQKIIGKPPISNNYILSLQSGSKLQHIQKSNKSKPLSRVQRRQSREK